MFKDGFAGFIRGDDGGGTVMGIFTAAMILLIGGLAVDGSNYWRNSQKMKQTADAAAHAGVVHLAMGQSESEARTAVLSAVEANMPQQEWGNVFTDAVGDVEFLNYDPDSNNVSTSGKPNAVRVTLSRNDGSGNPIRTLILGLSDLLTFGTETNLKYLDLSVDGVAVVAETRACKSTDGIYAQGQLRLSSSNSIGPGYCLHSQDQLWMSQQNRIAATAGLSMPDLARCNSKCDDTSNPGASAASFERNFIMPDFETHIDSVHAAFMGTGDTAIKDDFFFGKSVEAGAAQIFDDAGITYTSLSRGAVITMTEAEFEALPDIPRGLTYNVTCVANGNGGKTQLNLGQELPTTTNTTTATTTGSGALTSGPLQELAIMTNCSLDFGQYADIESVVLLSNRISATATVTAGSGATIGDTAWGCDVDMRSVVLARSDMHVPADFAGSNVQFVVDGNIHLSAASSSSSIDHSGVGFMASGEIDVASSHTFNSCNLPPSGLVPALQAIRFVEPGS
ncbi:TadE/TadG family type IV pilus assembly protein [Roseovarius aestuariivivens]|uniref:TadE/TadG family type IV pilus assembly protein n=1 Tax=Roseovarius aestuariivivens TaxID=1888910 RepID=UPI001436A80B|nr:TadE/TadG family type IV pilus assembly protein [Roseovarius aestuariivivens]